MVPNTAAGLDDDEVEPQREVRKWGAIGQHAALEQPVCGGPHPDALSGVHGLLG